MAALAATSSAVTSARQLLADVEAREARMSTGVGQGLALPHARTNAVRETVAAFATLATPVDYDALDGDPVRLVLLMAGPEAERSGHVRLLSRVSRLMSAPNVREGLLAARTAEAVLDTFRDAEASLA